MMRGMFSAISGLKNHQVMLDVTANDIANVNTIGYKSARTTFKDSLTQLQRGASGAGATNGGTNAAQVGLGVGLGSIDNLMSGGATQSTGNATRRRDPGRGLLPDHAAGHGHADRVPVHARRQLHHQHVGAPAHAGGLLRRRQERRRSRRRPVHGRSHRRADPAAGRRHEPRHRPGRLGLLHPRRRRGPRDRGLPLAGHVPNSAGLERASGNRWLGSANSGAEDVATPLVNGKGVTAAGNDRDVQRGPRADVHEHDHRPARLPGELARDLHLRRDAAGPRQPQALVPSLTQRRWARSGGPFAFKPRTQVPTNGRR